MSSNRDFRILIVDDEKKICEILMEILEQEGYEVSAVYNATDALKKMERQVFSMCLLDIKLPDLDGLSLLKKIKEQWPGLPVVVISAYGTVSSAVDALKSGADDFIEKPLEAARIIKTVRHIQEKQELLEVSRTFREEMAQRHRIIGESAEIAQLQQLIDRVAAAESSVLILGESGVGKELVARNLHLKSSRMNRPFIKVNCAALPGELIESELFGYEKGAFTGAYGRKPGQIELADTGTLFLDEIGDMSLSAQAKVLRTIEEKEIMHLGGTHAKKVNVRFLAATNQNLENLIREKKFREDLYHRINVIKITVPPLRERRSDIPLLADVFLKNACIDNNRPVKTLQPDALKIIMDLPWPGNVRELKYLMERLAILVDHPRISEIDIRGLMSVDEKFRAMGKTEMEQVRDQFERDYLKSILEQTGWHISKTAVMLGIDRSTLFRKMKKLGIIKGGKG